MAGPCLGFVIGIVILATAWPLLREAWHLALDGVPRHLDARAVADFLLAQPGVTGVHDLRLWATGAAATVLSAHVTGAGDNPELTQRLHDALRREFKIDQVTLQVETVHDHH